MREPKTSPTRAVKTIDFRVTSVTVFEPFFRDATHLQTTDNNLGRKYSMLKSRKYHWIRCKKPRRLRVGKRQLQDRV